MVELVDLRAKITRRCAAALAAEVKATGVDQSALVRDILEKWADERIHGCNVLVAELHREGLDAPCGRCGGKARE